MSASSAEHENQDPPALAKKVNNWFTGHNLMKNGFLFPIDIISVEHRLYASQSGQEGSMGTGV